MIANDFILGYLREKSLKSNDTKWKAHRVVEKALKVLQTGRMRLTGETTVYLPMKRNTAAMRAQSRASDARVGSR